MPPLRSPVMIVTKHIHRLLIDRFFTHYMKTRLAGFLIGLLLLIAVWLGIRSTFLHKPVETPISMGSSSSNSNQSSKKATLPRHSVGSSQRVRAPKKVAPEQADAEISRLLADDKVPVLEAAQGLIAIAADAMVLPAVRAEALQHGLNLTRDEDFIDLVVVNLDGNLFETPEMQRIALDDAYNRGNVAKISSVYSILKNAKGELRDEARELLAFSTQSDAEEIGDDMAKWEAIVKAQLLKESTDE